MNPPSGNRGSVSASIILHPSSFINRPAFTLIELLVVISIIALLLAVLLPVASRVRGQAKVVVCQANLRQWGIAYSAYIAENEGRMYAELPRTIRDDCLLVHLQPYLTDSNDMLTCPTAPRQSATIDGEVNVKETMWYPKQTGGYGSNFFVGGGSFEVGGRTYDRLKEWGRIPVVFDCGLHTAWPSHDDPPPEYEGDSSTLGGRWCPMKMVCINRHSGQIRMLFLDWSVRPVGLKEIWTLKWHSLFDTGGPWTKLGGVQPEDWPEWMRGFKDY